MNDISIIGLGKLGSCMLVSFASQGFQVIGVEKDEKRLKLLRNGKSFHFESNLEEYLEKFKNNITITADIQKAIEKSKITFVVVNTPSNEDGSYSTEQLSLTSQQIGEALKKKDGYHLVSITCTVMPGTTRNEIIPTIEKFSSKKVTKDFGVCYNPEFIALGSVIHDFLSPDFVLIGESDEKAGELLSKLYTKLLDNPKIRRMSLDSAEITKIGINCFLTMKISFANLMAQLCEKIPNGNIDIVTETLGLDPRIGKNYLKGGMSFGGPCLPRDNKAMSLAAKRLGKNFDLAEIIDKINENHIKHIANLAASNSDGGKIAILGGSYKPNTDVIEASPSIKIAKILIKKGLKVMMHDPRSHKLISEEYGSTLECSDSIKDCIHNADVCIVAIPWDEYKHLTKNDFENTKVRTIIDCWRILDFDSNRDIKIIKIGVNN